MLKGEYHLALNLTDPGFSSWVKIPNAARLFASGVSTAFGGTLEYQSGAGWILLSEAGDMKASGAK